ncbi:hypothetical protein RFI_38831, partial [Reticulomyxa filosa]
RCNAQLPIVLSFSFAIVNGHGKKIHIIGGVNNDNKQIHWVADVVKIYVTSSLLGIAQSYEVDILQNELVMRRIQSTNEKLIKRFEKEKKDIEILEDKYKRSNEQSMPDVNTMRMNFGAVTNNLKQVKQNYWIDFKIFRKI